MKALNKLSLAVCAVFGLCIFLMGAHIDELAKVNYRLKRDNKLLLYCDSLGRCENVKLRMKNMDLDTDHHLILNEIYKLKRK